MLVDEFLDIIKLEKKSLYLFGAGRVAQVLYNVCTKNKIAIQGFCVSDVQKNKSVYNGLPVIDVKHLAIADKNADIVIAVFERGEKKIEKFLRDLGFTSVFSVPDGILDYDPWAAKRYRSPIIEVTSKIGCSVNCRFCPQSTLLSAYFKDDKKRKSVMTFMEFKSYLDVLPQETIVDFSGFVEPFLNHDSLAMMEYTAQSGHECALYTTFRGLTPDEFDRLIKIPFKNVCVHTADADGYANIPVTQEYLAVFAAALEAKKTDGSPFIDTANCQSEPHPEVLKLTQGKLKVYCEMSDRAGNLDPNAANLVHVQKEGKIRCSRAVAMNHFVLLPDGSLVLCCNDYGLKHVVGNLNKSSYEQIMRGEEMKRIWCAMSSDREDIICRKCYFAEREA